jgi:ubiquinone/menaquinone biosynthesis C-methylase UbiE
MPDLKRDPTSKEANDSIPGWDAVALAFRRVRKVARQRVRKFSKARAKPENAVAAPSAVPESRTPDASYESTYRAHLSGLQKKLSTDVAQQQAVGGHFDAVGKLERALLLQLGLKPEHQLIDVGCGSGRLASQLASMPGLRYLGTDVVPDMLDYARQTCKRDDWQFIPASGFRIPAADQSADFVCFFSVLTHLRHEDSYRYLRDAKRVLKPGGAIVFSFIEFALPLHWGLFEPLTTSDLPHHHVDQFVERDAIRAWAQHLELDVEALYDGDKPHIRFEGAITWDDGRVMLNEGNLGQSVAVLRTRHPSQA